MTNMNYIILQLIFVLKCNICIVIKYLRGGMKPFNQLVHISFDKRELKSHITFRISIFVEPPQRLWNPRDPRSAL